mmetsp:Transcript_4988/g.16985  ORF Transcript_4988/g.16985 Transcript_4988/m.16985 type:complete len:220 (+) Transcript_4988:579-1238(+)
MQVCRFRTRPKPRPSAVTSTCSIVTSPRPVATAWRCRSSQPRNAGLGKGMGFAPPPTAARASKSAPQDGAGAPPANAPSRKSKPWLRSASLRRAARAARGRELSTGAGVARELGVPGHARARHGELREARRVPAAGRHGLPELQGRPLRVRVARVARGLEVRVVPARRHPRRAAPERRGRRRRRGVPGSAGGDARCLSRSRSSLDTGKARSQGGDRQQA